MTITFSGPTSGHTWAGDTALVTDLNQIKTALKDLNSSHLFVQNGETVGLCEGGQVGSGEGLPVVAHCPPINPVQLGDSSFMAFHGVTLPYFAGSMANGISSAEMVIALGKEGILASFGAAGLTAPVIEKAIDQIQTALPNGPYCFNLIHSPTEPALESQAVKLYLERGVTTLEASAYLDVSLPLVHYRVAGLSKDANGNVVCKNKIIAKISRKEVATRFMEPPSEKYLKAALDQGLVTAEQVEIARTMPLADDVTVEADSGGHTDNRPLVSLLPAIISLRDEIQAKRNYPTEIRVGAGGGIGSPEAALATFMMGAAYIVTGTINQACKESGSSDHVRKALAQADMADVMMAPASDMFEMGVKLQVLKRGTLFPMRAGRLYELYLNNNSIDDIDPTERAKLEKTVFQRPLEDVWADCVAFFTERDPETIKKAQGNEKRKMALIFRWYLGLSSRWANTNEKGREMDYQIWCGPAIGPFNDWTKGTSYESFENRYVAPLAIELMNGAAYLYRCQALKMQGLKLPNSILNIKPQ
ncbi:MAG: PfaD family polyunsaturated fatty acid/polyketide biosynthesis protein [SAR324 cluster bacterium]|nr:PfaD family polyunsaturated fatty acid/polyketide biosynthesis protein [SAR324 cluster bacterium]